MADRLVSVDENYMFPPPLEDRLDGKVKASTDAATLGSSTKPIQLLGTEDVRTLSNADYRVGSSSVATSLGLPSTGHGFLHIKRNATSGLLTWNDVSPTDPATWVSAQIGEQWSPWQRTDGLKALAEAKAYADTVTLDASSGPKVIALDTDNVPYYSTTAGTHRLFPDSDGAPYFSRNPWPATSTDTDGAPVITY